MDGPYGKKILHKTECKIVSTKVYKTLPKEEWIGVKGTHEAIVTEKGIRMVAAMIGIKSKPTIKRDKFIFKQN